MAWLIASLSYSRPFTKTSLCSKKGDTRLTSKKVIISWKEASQDRSFLSQCSEIVEVSMWKWTNTGMVGKENRSLFS